MQNQIFTTQKDLKSALGRVRKNEAVLWRNTTLCLQPITPLMANVEELHSSILTRRGLMG